MLVSARSDAKLLLQKEEAACRVIRERYYGVLELRVVEILDGPPQEHADRPIIPDRIMSFTGREVVPKQQLRVNLEEIRSCRRFS